MSRQGESAASIVHFGTFEVDLATGELRRKGARVRLQEQPFRILAMLLEAPGALVTREQLRQRIWPEAVFVDFEHGLNKAVSKLRRALGDTAEAPRFVETLPRRGYRFVAPVGDARPAIAAPPGAATLFRVVWQGRAIPLPEGTSVLGRDPAADVCVDAASVSRRHARIVVSRQGASLEDLGSKNGTALNGRLLTAPAGLRDGDEIRLGVEVLSVRAYANRSTQTQAGGT